MLLRQIVSGDLIAEENVPLDKNLDRGSKFTFFDRVEQKLCSMVDHSSKGAPLVYIALSVIHGSRSHIAGSRSHNSG